MPIKKIGLSSRPRIGLRSRIPDPDPLRRFLPDHEEVEAAQVEIEDNAEEGFFTALDGLSGTQTLRALLAGDVKRAWDSNPLFELFRVLVPKEVEDATLGDEARGLTFTDVRNAWGADPGPDDGVFMGVVDFLGNFVFDTLTWFAPYAKGAQMLGKGAAKGATLAESAARADRVLLTFGAPFGHQTKVMRIPLKKFDLPVANALEAASSWFHTSAMTAPVMRGFGKTIPTGVRSAKHRGEIRESVEAKVDTMNEVGGFYNLGLAKLATDHPEVLKDGDFARVFWTAMELGVVEADDAADFIKVLDGTTMGYSSARLRRNRALKGQDRDQLLDLEDRMMQALPSGKDAAKAAKEDIAQSMNSWRTLTSHGALPEGVVSRFRSDKRLRQFLEDGVDTPASRKPRTVDEALGDAALGPSEVIKPKPGHLYRSAEKGEIEEILRSGWKPGGRAASEDFAWHMDDNVLVEFIGEGAGVGGTHRAHKGAQFPTGGEGHPTRLIYDEGAMLSQGWDKSEIESVISRFKDKFPDADIVNASGVADGGAQHITRFVTKAQDKERLVDIARRESDKATADMIRGMESADLDQVKKAVEDSREYFQTLSDNDTMAGIFRAGAEKHYSPRIADQKFKPFLDDMFSSRADSFRGKKYTEMTMFSVIQHLADHGDVVTKMMPLEKLRQLGYASIDEMPVQEKVWRALSDIIGTEQLRAMKKFRGDGEAAVSFFKQNPFNAFNDRVAQSANKQGLKAMHDRVFDPDSDLYKQKLSGDDLPAMMEAMANGDQVVIRHRDPNNEAFRSYDTAPDSAKVLTPTLQSERDADVLRRRLLTRDLLKELRRPGESGLEAAKELDALLLKVDELEPGRFVETHTAMDQWTRRRAEIIQEVKDLTALKKKGAEDAPWGTPVAVVNHGKAQVVLDQSLEQVSLAEEMVKRAKENWKNNPTLKHARQRDKAMDALSDAKKQRQAAVKAVQRSKPSGGREGLEHLVPESQRRGPLQSGEVGEVAEEAAKIGGPLRGRRGEDLIGKKINDLNSELTYVNGEISVWRDALGAESQRTQEILGKLLDNLENVDRYEVGELANIYMDLHNKGALSLNELRVSNPELYDRVTKHLKDVDVFTMDKEIYDGIYGAQGVFSRMQDPGGMNWAIGTLFDKPGRWMKTWMVSHPLYLASRVRDWVSTATMVAQNGLRPWNMGAGVGDANNLTFAVSRALRTGDLDELRAMKVGDVTGEEFFKEGIRAGAFDNSLRFDETLIDSAQAAQNHVGVKEVIAKPFQFLLDSINMFKAPSKNMALMSGANMIKTFDHHARIAAASGFMRQGLSSRDAFRNVMKATYDPRRVDLSNAERQFVGPLTAFYPFLKKSVTGQAAAFANHPGNVKTFNTIAESFEDMVGLSEAELDLAMPAYMRKMFAVPISVDEETGEMTTVLAGGVFPLTDVAKFGVAAGQMMRALTPFDRDPGATDPLLDVAGERMAPHLKMVIEWARNRSYFLGQETERVPGEVGEFGPLNVSKKFASILHGFRIYHEMAGLGWFTATDINNLIDAQSQEEGVVENPSVWHRLFKSSLSPLPFKIKTTNASRAVDGRIRHAKYQEGLKRHSIRKAIEDQSGDLREANLENLRELVARDRGNNQIALRLSEKLLGGEPD